jgi:hypothetical protein
LHCCPLQIFKTRAVEMPQNQQSVGFIGLREGMKRQHNWAFFSTI